MITFLFNLIINNLDFSVLILYFIITILFFNFFMILGIFRITFFNFDVLLKFLSDKINLFISDLINISETYYIHFAFFIFQLLYTSYILIKIIINKEYKITNFFNILLSFFIIFIIKKLLIFFNKSSIILSSIMQIITFLILIPLFIFLYLNYEEFFLRNESKIEFYNIFDETLEIAKKNLKNKNDDLVIYVIDKIYFDSMPYNHFYELKINNIDYYLLVVSVDLGLGINNRTLVYSKKNNLIEIKAPTECEFLIIRKHDFKAFFLDLLN